MLWMARMRMLPGLFFLAVLALHFFIHRGDAAPSDQLLHELARRRADHQQCTADLKGCRAAAAAAHTSAAEGLQRLRKQNEDLVAQVAQLTQRIEELEEARRVEEWGFVGDMEGEADPTPVLVEEVPVSVPTPGENRSAEEPKPDLAVPLAATGLAALMKPQFLLYSGRGGHSNQLTCLMHALELGRLTGRTVVLPNMGRFSPEQLYDLTRLPSHGYSFVGWEQFVTILPLLNVSGVACSGRLAAEVAALGLRCGNHPPRVDLRAIPTSWPRLDATLLFVNPKVLEVRTTACALSLLGPSPAMKAEVESFLKRTRLPRPYTAVHARFLANDCRSWARIGALDHRAALQACDLTAAYIRSHGATPSVVLATDSYYLRLGQELRALQYSPQHSADPAFFTFPVASQVVETWLMVEADRFIGVPQSMMSMHVCLLREMRGKSCLDNLPGSSFFQLTFSQLLFVPTPARVPQHCNATVQAQYAPFIDALPYLAEHRLATVPPAVVERHLALHKL